MKLLSLHIDKYKNLSGDYDFTTQVNISLKGYRS